MNFLNSDKLLDLLERQKMLTGPQRQKITLEKGKQRQKLLKRADDNEGSSDKSYPDLVDIVASFHMEIGGRKGVLLDDEAIMQAVARDFKLPFKKLDPLTLDMDIVTRTIPRNFAVSHLLLPFNKQDGLLEIAVYHPDNKTVLADIEQANQVTVRPYLATKSDIRKIQAEFFGFQKSIRAAESQFAGPGVGGSVDIGNLEQFVKLSSAKEISSSDQHIKSAVDHLFHYAFDQRASDIHIEPKRDASQVRLRIDGVLHTIYKLPKAVHAAIISRIKTLSRLDIAGEAEAPGRPDQDGLAEARRRRSGSPPCPWPSAKRWSCGSSIRISSSRISTISASFPRDLQVYQDPDHQRPHGIVLVTGPTGSGKSTTLYSTLKMIATPEKNIVTVEDPVEMVHEEFNQISVQPPWMSPSATILRNILRQDPDIIMIGEIRDLETAVNAIQAALTGHLVFSTLHTNDAVSAISRLIDLGAQPFLVGSTLMGCHGPATGADHLSAMRGELSDGAGGAAEAGLPGLRQRHH